jgi:hypothetical protein
MTGRLTVNSAVDVGSTSLVSVRNSGEGHFQNGFERRPAMLELGGGSLALWERA